MGCVKTRIAITQQFRYPIPDSSDYSRAIAGFLDRETARIDELVDKKIQAHQPARGEAKRHYQPGYYRRSRSLGSDA